MYIYFAMIRAKYVCGYDDNKQDKMILVHCLSHICVCVCVCVRERELASQIQTSSLSPDYFDLFLLPWTLLLQTVHLLH